MPQSPKIRIGFAGAGNIFDAYGAGLARFRDRVEVRRVADVDLARAEQRATRYGIPAWGPLEDLLADPDVDVVINITPPTTHAEVTVAAARADKHVFTEKPVATSTEAAATMLEIVSSTGKRFGSAP